MLGRGVGVGVGVGLGVADGPGVGVGLGDGLGEGDGDGDATAAAAITVGAGSVTGLDGAEAGPCQSCSVGTMVYITGCPVGGESSHARTGEATVQTWTASALPTTCRLTA